jgi:hypothetical protein
MESGEEEEPPVNRHKREDLTSDERKQIVSALTARMKDGTENCALKRGSQKEVAI